MNKVKDPNKVVFRDDGFVYVMDGSWKRIDVDNKLKRDEDDCVSLADIQNQYEEWPMLTVVHISFLAGEIYQVGNYSDGRWWQIGELDGFA